MASAMAVAQTFLYLAAREGQALTNMKLQKLVFFSHGVHLAAYGGAPLIDDPIRAWDFGPVIPPLYERLRRFGKGTVAADLGPCESMLLANSELQAIRSVWEAYKGYDAWALSRITHQPQSPWSQVWETCRYGDIPNALIELYYRARVTKKHAS